MSVLVMGAIGVSVGLSLILLGIDAGRSNSALADSLRARGLADACAEHALNALRLSSSYAGDETIAFSLGTCSILPVQGAGAEKTIRVSGASGGATRKIEIVTSALQPNISIESWTEMDF